MFAACLAIAFPAALLGCVETRTRTGGFGGFTHVRSGDGPQANIFQSASRNAASTGGGSSWEASLARTFDISTLGVPIEGAPHRFKDADGQVRLLRLSPRQVIYHLHTCLVNEEYELIDRELIAQRIKAELEAAGTSSQTPISTLRTRRDEVLAFLRTVPLGELTPGARMRSIGGIYRLTSPGAGVTRFSVAEFVLENRQLALYAIR